MIKKIKLLVIFLSGTLCILAQVPQAFKYQAVVRDTSGFIIADQNVSLKISILSGDLNGESVYSEIHNVITNNLGIINLEIGRGEQPESDFSLISWGTNSYFLKLEIDLQGNSNYQALGISQLLSVPYALYAEKSSPDTANYWHESSNGIFYNEGNAGIGTAEPDNSALLELASESKGFLPPRLSNAQILAINSPANGLIVFCTDDNKFYAYIEPEDHWKELLFGSGIINPSFPCADSSFTINHIAGDVAPVTKTVTYTTITEIPGEPTKCWITSNLGADHEASNVYDASEESAGWCWQFNLKQGYKHDGYERTPNTFWITDIQLFSNWVAENDPCALEVGNAWRLPSYTELYNIDAAGGWEDWNGPWESKLKVHAAGYLFGGSGVLMQRGETGAIWSNTQYDHWNAYYLYIQSDVCYMKNYLKTYATSVRCIRD